MKTTPVLLENNEIMEAIGAYIGKKRPDLHGQWLEVVNICSDGNGKYTLTGMVTDEDPRRSRDEVRL